MDRRKGLEVNIDKSKVMGVSKRDEIIRIIIKNRKSEYVDYFIYLGSILTKDDYCTREIFTRIANGKRAFTKYRMLQSSKLSLTEE